MEDPTEDIRKELIAKQQEAGPKTKEQLEKENPGPVLTTEELSAQYDVLGFMAPFVVVRRKSDGRRGSLLFQHMPRFYYSWAED